MDDLNKVLIPSAELLTGFEQKNHSTSSEKVKVYFKDLEKNLINHIEEAEGIVGCIAWLTSKPILRSLGKKETGVALVVQKEKFLRIDGHEGKNFLKERRQLYDAISSGPRVLARMIGGTMTSMYSGPDYSLQGEIERSGFLDDSMDPIRCVGLANDDPYAGRMHNKFLVFCKHSAEWPPLFIPYAVWTGSFNFSNTATKSFENAVVIYDEVIARAYMQEFSQISALSEPLDWTNTNVDPEFRMN